MVRKPNEPAPGECCGSGCARCVWDIYYDNLDKYESWRADRKLQIKTQRQAGVERKVLDIEDLRGGGQDDDDNDFDETDEEVDGATEIGHVAATSVGSVVVKYELGAMMAGGGAASGPSATEKALDALLAEPVAGHVDKAYVSQLRGYLYGEEAEASSSIDADELRKYGGLDDAEGDDDEEERSAKSSMMVGGSSANNNGVYGISSDSAVHRFPEVFGAEVQNTASTVAPSRIDRHIVEFLQHQANSNPELLAGSPSLQAAIKGLNDAPTGFVAQRQRQELLLGAKQRLRRLVMKADVLLSESTSATPQGTINVSLLPPKAVDYVIGGASGGGGKDTTPSNSNRVGGIPIEAANPHQGALVHLYDAVSDERQQATPKEVLQAARQQYVDGGWRMVETVELVASSSPPYTRGAPPLPTEGESPLCLLRLRLRDVTGAGTSSKPHDSTPTPGDVLDLYTENSDVDVMWLCKRLGIQPGRKLSLSPSPFGPEGGFPRWLPSPFNHRFHHGVTLQETDVLQLQNPDANLKRLESDLGEVGATAPSLNDPEILDATERQRRAKEKQSAIISDALVGLDDSEEDNLLLSEPSATTSSPLPSSLWLTSRCLPHLTAKHLFQRYVDLHSSAYLRPPLFTMLIGCLREPMGYDEKIVLSMINAANKDNKIGHSNPAALKASLVDALNGGLNAYKDEDVLASLDYFCQRAALALLTHTHPSQQVTAPPTTNTSPHPSYLISDGSTPLPPPLPFATQRDTHQTLSRLVNTTNPSMRDVLSTFSQCKPNLPRLLEVAAPLRPRRFSVASVSNDAVPPGQKVEESVVELLVRQIVKPATPSVGPTTPAAIVVEGICGFRAALFAEMGVLSLLQCVESLHKEASQISPPHPDDGQTYSSPEPFCGFITQRLVEMAMCNHSGGSGKREREAPLWARHIPVRSHPQFALSATAAASSPSASPLAVSHLKVRQLLDRSKWCPFTPIFPLPVARSLPPSDCGPLTTLTTVLPHHPVFVIAGGSGYAPLRGWLYNRLAAQKQLLRASPTAAVGTTTVLMGLRRCAEAVVLAQDMEPWSRLDSTTTLPLKVNAYLSRAAEDGSDTADTYLPNNTNHLPPFLHLHAGMRISVGEKEASVFMDPQMGEEVAACIIDDRLSPPPPSSSSASNSNTVGGGGVVVACGPGPFLSSVREAIISAVSISTRLFPAEDRGDRSIAEHCVAKAEHDRRIVFDTWKAL